MDDLIEEIHQKLQLEDVVLRYKDKEGSSGDGFMIECPFHDDNDPSMSVTNGEGFFCHACPAKGGDTIEWIKMIEGVGFREALKLLKKRFDLEAPIGESSDGESQAAKKKRLRVALREAVRYYHSALKDTEEAQGARKYLTEERGFSEATIDNFALGYAPTGSAALRKSGSIDSDPDALQKAGVLSQEDHQRERFRGRIIFPIRGHLGNLAGMAGRIDPSRSNTSNTKYINSRETLLYKKKEVLYGLASARSSIREHSQAFVVEGYTDVLRFWQEGIPNVVASCGTSFSTEQGKRLSHHADEIVFVFDGDDAGQQSVRQALKRTIPRRATPKVVPLSDGTDPDDLANTHGENTLRILEKKQKGVIQFLLEIGKRNGKTESPEGRLDIQEEMTEVIAQISNSNLRREYIKDVARAVGAKPSHVYVDVQRLRDEPIDEEAKRLYEKIEGAGHMQQMSDGEPSASGEADGPAEQSSPPQNTQTSGTTDDPNAETSGERRQPSWKKLMTEDDSCIEVAKETYHCVRGRLESKKPMVERFLLRMSFEIGRPAFELTRIEMETGRMENQKARRGFQDGWKLLEKGPGDVSIGDLEYETRKQVDGLLPPRELIRGFGGKPSLIDSSRVGVFRGALAAWMLHRLSVVRETITGGEQELSFSARRQLRTAQRKIEGEKEMRRVHDMIEGKSRSVGEGLAQVSCSPITS